MMNGKLCAWYVFVFVAGLALAQDMRAELPASDAIKGAINRALGDINVGRETAFVLSDAPMSRTLLEQSVHLVQTANALEGAFADGIYQACQELHRLMATARVKLKGVQQNLKYLQGQLRSQGRLTEAVDKALSSLLVGISRLLLLTR